jgi:tricorn protease
MWQPLLLVAPLTAASAPAWPRTPTLHGETVVFAAAGSLWEVGLGGGEAQAVSAAGAAQQAPALSPDGRRLAYSARVDGNLEVHVLTRADGRSLRLTWHGGSDEVVGWSPDGAEVWFRSGRHDPSGYADVFAVPVEGGTVRRVLPTPTDTPGMSESAAADPAGTRLVATDRHVAWLAWARNTGGLAPGLRVGPEAGPLLQVGPTPAWDPHWSGGRLWFLSDMGGWPRLASMSADGSDVRWHTVDAPGLRELDVAVDGRAVFVRDGALGLWSEQTGEVALVVRLPDSVVPRTAAVPLLGPDATLVAQATDDQIGVVQRGQVVVHDGAGTRVMVHARPGVRYGPASFVGDALLAQAHDGEMARLVWSRPARGRDRRLGAPLDAPLVGLVASPDGRHAAAVDTLRRVWWIDLRSGARRALGQSALEAPDPRIVWRPDSAWVAFVLRDVQGQRSVMLAAAEGPARRIGDPRVDAHGPAWVDGGASLAFLAEQAPEIVMDHRDVAYVSRHAALPMAAPVDPEGRPGRARAVGSAGAWDALVVVDGTLLGRRGDALLPVDDADTPSWADAVGPCDEHTGLCLAEARLVRVGEAGAEGVGVLSQAELVVDRPAEWRQLVGEACGQASRHRWDRDHDTDAWAAACARARDAVGLVSTRREVTDILRLLLAELSAAHSFAWGGDRAELPSGPRPALLGADLTWTEAGWRVRRVLVPDAITPAPAPLADAGVGAGRCIVAVDGAALDAAHPPAALLPRGGGPATLSLTDCAGSAASDVGVQSIVDEGPLRLADRVRLRAATVESRSEGRLAYVYMPDVNDLGLVAFEQAWGGQRGREGVILDLRRNGGGWYSDAIVDRLSRNSDARFRWTGGGDQTWPIRSGGVPVVVLVDAGTMSEGEILTRGLQLGGATVIGEPTWGGLSGDVTPRPLVDGGGVGIPAVVWVDPEHGTALERRGVIPDVQVDPTWTADAGDPWLEAALGHLGEAP